VASICFRDAARFKCSQQPHQDYKIVLKEIYDDYYYKKHFRAVFIACHAILHHICHPSVLRHIHRPSRYFVATHTH
jgi:hypothetical protein